MIKVSLMFFVLLLIFTMVSCEKGLNEDDTGILLVRLTDAPFPIDKIEKAEVIIDSIEVRQKDSESDGRPFILLSDEQRTYNLLDLQNGVTTDLIEMEVPAGDYDLIRLYVQSAMIELNDDGKTTFDLKIPSGEQTGIKVFLEPVISVVGGLTTELILDFDVRKSFVVQGNPDTHAGIKGFHFKPVIRAINVSITGSIVGKVTDTLGEGIGSVFITLEQDGADLDPSAQTDTDEEDAGKYLISGLDPGVYKVIATKEGYVTADSSGVEVLVGNQSQVDFVLEAE